MPEVSLVLSDGTNIIKLNAKNPEHSRSVIGDDMAKLGAILSKYQLNSDGDHIKIKSVIHEEWELDLGDECG